MSKGKRNKKASRYPRPSMTSEAVKLLDEGQTIEVFNLVVFKLMRYIEKLKKNCAYDCRINGNTQGWTTITPKPKL